MTDQPFVAKHIWVNTQIINEELAPGILLEWRREDDGSWWGLVMWAQRERGRGRSYWSARTQWVEADRITQERE